MTAPIETAYRGFATRLGQTLVAAGVLATGDQLKVDPASAIEVAGDTTQWFSGVMLDMGTAPTRTLLGSGAARYVVERRVQVEFGAASSDVTWVNAKLDAALAAAAGLPNANPTLDGLVERLALLSAEVDDLAPLGRKVSLSFILRLRSADPLGMTS